MVVFTCSVAHQSIISASMGTETVQIKTVPELWPSTARIVACLGVFWGHFVGMYDVNVSPWDFNSFRIFMFLAGYFAFIPGEPDFCRLTGWFIRKVKSLMIPYWLVIIPVIVLNGIIGYKPQTVVRNVAVLLGGGMLLNNPLYIIAWFITFILLLWFFIYLFQIPRKWGGRLLVFVAGLGFFSVFADLNNNGIDEPFDFLIFFSGYVLRALREASGTPVVPIRFIRLSLLLFKVQNYAYSYILIHGAVVLMAAKVFDLPKVWAFSVSLVGSAALSFLHFHISLWLQKRVPFPFEKKYPYQRPGGAVQGRIA